MEFLWNGMRYSLSRDIIADSMETGSSTSYDGLITVVGCDKNIRFNGYVKAYRPSILVYGGTIDSGCYNNKELMLSQHLKHGERKLGK